jgi:hypothetical protein
MPPLSASWEAAESQPSRNWGHRRASRSRVAAVRRRGTPNRPRSSGRTSQRGHHDRGRKSWCLRFERAHDHPTRFDRASALQELRGIASVSASRPLFIPFLRIARDTLETARSSVQGGFRAMARPGLEPGTPRFSVVTSHRPSGAKSLEDRRFLRDGLTTLNFAICVRFHPFQGMADLPSPFWPRGLLRRGT